MFNEIQVGLLYIAFQKQCNKYLQVLIPDIYGTINENLLSELCKLDFYQKSLDFEIVKETVLPIIENTK